ncbi:MAG TPA: ABC transporter permease [Candidatus Babeliales bacterium]|nr:ABC transporter permease [Candidatus Babeliales bacterium]
MFAPAVIWAVIIRHLRTYIQDFNLTVVGFFWPLFDILVWGMLGAWIQQSQPEQLRNYQVTALLAIILWQVVSRGAHTMIRAFNEELASNNIVNLFSLPIATSDWVIGMILFSTIRTVVSSIFCILIIYGAYGISIWYMISTFLIFFPPLFFSCIWVGLTCLQIMISIGRRGIELGFIVGWVLAPFSGVFYPTDILPYWAQTISAVLPMSYVFSGMRGYVMHQQDPTSYLIIGYILSVLYAISAIILFIYCFNRSKKNGLSRLAD